MCKAFVSSSAFMGCASSWLKPERKLLHSPTIRLHRLIFNLNIRKKNEYTQYYHRETPHAGSDPYTGEERKVLNSGDRRRQILARIAIDRERYTEAMIDSPDMRPHFTRLISIGVRSEDAWEEHFAQYPGDGGLVPGTEGPANISQPTETSTANHIDASA